MNKSNARQKMSSSWCNASVSSTILKIRRRTSYSFPPQAEHTRAREKKIEMKMLRKETGNFFYLKTFFLSVLPEILYKNSHKEIDT